MCGLAGFIGDGSKEYVDDVLLRRMSDTIIHRGPDDGGSWCDIENRVALGHRRLSILDLSPAGHQPMVSSSGRYVIAFNGEIYNHLDLRKELEMVAPPIITLRPSPASGLAKSGWRGHSDTETLLASFEAWGIQPTIERAIGMFAIAVWDRQEKTLTLVRDRIGEKPLYYGWQGDSFLFGSELKVLRAHPSFRADIDRGALCLFMRQNYIPAPYSIYQGIFKLQPGCLLTVSLNRREPQVSTYWSVVQVAGTGVANPFNGSADQAVDELEVLLKDSVRQQMMADVPLGAFLSGGVDSSTVVALMQAQSARPVKTFTIGFDDDGYNEAVHAKAVAKHLGTEHTELYVTSEQARAVIPLLPTLYDEPFADSSQIPTFLVSQLARQHVSVSLSGDAGDELFCGYSRYVRASKMWGMFRKMPTSFRWFVSNSVSALPIAEWDRVGDPLINGLRLGKQKFSVGFKLHKVSDLMKSRSIEELYYGLNSYQRSPSSLVIGGQEPPTLMSGMTPSLEGLDTMQRMMALDILTYLPDDILVKVDRAAMGVSLESRVPMLDHRVVEFAWRLPEALRIRDGQTKWVLRQVLYRYVPRDLIDRPKMGFGVPLDDWLRTALREWAEALLDEGRLRSEGYFEPQPIRKMWDEHLSGARNWSTHLWSVLMFQAWLENEKK